MRHCEICGKGMLVGNTVARRGLPKKKGGIGLHTTGITKRRFYPNIQRIRILRDGKTIRAYVCTSCIKSGKVSKV